MALTRATPQLVSEARSKREDGATYQEIADSLEVAFSTAYEWVNGVPTKACPRCGRPQNKRAKTACRDCRSKLLTREEIVSALRTWAETHDGVPPGTDDWKRASERWPRYGDVHKVFGRWDDALLAAGFAPRRKTPAFEVLVAEIREGATVSALARKYGVTPAGIYDHFTRRGQTHLIKKKRS